MVERETPANFAICFKVIAMFVLPFINGTAPKIYLQFSRFLSSNTWIKTGRYWTFHYFSAANMIQASQLG
jgi:hypothetical protein